MSHTTTSQSHSDVNSNRFSSSRQQSDSCPIAVLVKMIAPEAASAIAATPWPATAILEPSRLNEHVGPRKDATGTIATFATSSPSLNRRNVQPLSRS